MNKHIYRFFPVLLIAFVFASCATEDPLINDIKTNINSQNFDEAIALADTAVLRYPGTGLPFFLKADAQGRMAGTVEMPRDRAPYYRDMRENLNKAKELFAQQEEKPEEAGQINQIQYFHWSNEFNTAITYVNNDSVRSMVEEPLEWAIGHMINTTIIIPDTSNSYETLARIYGMNGEFAEAAEAMTNAINYTDSATVAQYDLLSAYYLNTEDFEGALSVLEESMEMYPDSIVFIERAVDAYIRTNNVDKGLSLLDNLIENNPTNAQYSIVKGQQINLRVNDLVQDVESNLDRLFDLRNEDDTNAEKQQLNKEDEEMIAEIDRLAEISQEALNRAATIAPDNPSVYLSLGNLYQDLSYISNKQAATAIEDDVYERYNKIATERAEKAVENYEKYTELVPDNTNVWQTLFRLYTYLDMRDKAEEAMEKAGM